MSAILACVRCIDGFSSSDSPVLDRIVDILHLRKSHFVWSIFHLEKPRAKSPHKILIWLQIKSTDEYTATGLHRTYNPSTMSETLDFPSFPPVLDITEVRPKSESDSDSGNGSRVSELSEVVFINN